MAQKEREYAKEAKRKNEEMKEKLYSLRNQKMELKGRILEMQSTISSLKEEHKAMELALEENQDEIKLIIEKEQDVNKENRHGTALTRVLKHKEAEIEDLRCNLDLPVKVWSVSTDDPSNPPVNLTTNVSIAQRDETELGENKENSGGLHKPNSSSRDKKTLIRDADGRGNKSTTNGDGENATVGEDRRETGVRVANTREMNGEEQSQKLEVSQQGFGHGNTTNEKGAEQSQGTNTGVSQDHRGFGIVTQKTETTVNAGVDVQKPRHEDGDVKGTENKEPESTSRRQFADDQELGVHYEGTMKLEIPEKFRSGESHRSRGIRATIRKVNGKKWKTLAKKRLTENEGKYEEDEVASIRGRKFFKDAMESERKKRLREEELQKQIRDKDQDMGLNIRNESNEEDEKLKLSNVIRQRKGPGSKIDMQENKNEKDASMITKSDEKREESSEEVNEAAVSSELKFPKSFSELKFPKPENSKDAESEYTRVGNSVIDGNYRISRKSYHSLDEVQLNKTIKGEGSGVAANDTKQKPNGIVQSEEQADGFSQHERNGIDKIDNDSKQINAADKNEELGDLEVKDIHESDTHNSLQFSTKLDKDRADFKEETDEPDF